MSQSTSYLKYLKYKSKYMQLKQELEGGRAKAIIIGVKPEAGVISLLAGALLTEANINNPNFDWKTKVSENMVYGLTKENVQWIKQFGGKIMWRELKNMTQRERENTIHAAFA